jgi:hypothetical protein
LPSSAYTIEVLSIFWDVLNFRTSFLDLSEVLGFNFFLHPSPSRSSKYFGTSILRPQLGPPLRLLPCSFTIQILKSFRDILASTASILRPQLGPRLLLLPSSITIQILKSFRDILAFGASILRPQLGRRLLLLPSSFTIQILKKLLDLDLGISLRFRDLDTDK